MQKHQQLKATWLNDVKSALHTYRRQHFPSSEVISTTKNQRSAEGEHTAQTLSLIEQQIKDTKNRIRHSRLGNGSVMSTLGAFELSGPAARHSHAKALHQYKRKLNHYEHMKEMLRKDGVSA